jgi:hypothetical protein
MERGFEIWKEVAVQFLGRTIRGSYSQSDDGSVTVNTPLGSKTSKVTRPGGWPAKFIAERLLRELAIAGKA